LQEQPAGGFAREAAGRLIEAHRAAGNRAAAQTAARSYLTRYPNGPHAELARSLLP
jgi:outer membrane protein assembly factor BamD (BamD/ComL family)